MSQFVSKIGIAVLSSFLINAPFAIGELLTRDESHPRTEFPFSLFIALWIEVGVFAYLLMSVVKTFRSGTANEKPIRLTLQILILGILAWAWGTLIVDQWACFFFGGSGC